MGVEMGFGLQCMALQFLDSSADVLLRGGGEFLGQNLCALFDGVQFTGKAVPKFGQGRTDFLLDRCLRGARRGPIPGGARIRLALRSAVQRPTPPTEVETLS